MNTEYFPAGFNYRTRFPDSHCVLAGEGEACYAATDGTDGVLITDSGGLADMLDEEDLSDCAISVRRFSSVAKRDIYVADLLAGCRREDEDYC